MLIFYFNDSSSTDVFSINSELHAGILNFFLKEKIGNLLNIFGPFLSPFSGTTEIQENINERVIL